MTYLYTWHDKYIHVVFDWCCLYYFKRNSPVTLLETLFSRIFLRFEISVYYHFEILSFVCVCVRPSSLTQNFFHHSQLASCVRLSLLLLCADHTLMYTCVSVPVCVSKCVIKVISNYEHKQKRDNIMYNIKVKNRNWCSLWCKISSEVTNYQTRDRIQYEQTKYNKRVRIGPWGYRIATPSLLSLVHYCSTGPRFDALWACVPL